MTNMPRRTRIDVAWTMEMRYLNGPALWGRTINVSSTGMLFLSQECHNVGNLLAVLIRVDPNCTLRCVIRIARQVSTVPRIHTYGAQFVGFKDNDNQILDQKLQAIQQSRPKPAAQPTPKIKKPLPVAIKKQAPTEIKPASVPTAIKLRWGPNAEHKR